MLDENPFPEFDELSEQEQAQVDERLDEFVAALRRGEATNLESYLMDLSPAVRYHVVREALLEQREWQREKVDSKLVGFLVVVLSYGIASRS